MTLESLGPAFHSTTIIRVGLVGLSADDTTSADGSRHLAYLLSQRGTRVYRITALLDSDTAAADAAKARFDLPSSVHVFSRVADLIAARRIELLVVCAPAGRHLPMILEAIRAGMPSFFRWPLANTLVEAEALASAYSRPENSIVDLSNRASPVAAKIRELLNKGRIGRVLSSTVTVHNGQGASQEHKPLADVVHTMDLVYSILGNIDKLHSQTQGQQAISDTSNSPISRGYTVVAIVGRFDSSHSSVANADDATLTATFHSGPPFKGQMPVEWCIVGDRHNPNGSSKHVVFADG